MKGKNDNEEGWGTKLPEGGVKGGTSLKLRFGKATTRYATDLDAARAGPVEDFRQRLAGGWEGFSNRVVEVRQAHPKDAQSHM